MAYQTNQQTQQLRNLNPAQVKEAWNKLQMLNPNTAMKQLMSNYPMLAPLLNSRSPQEAVYALARQKGIDPNELINQLNDMLR